MKYFLTLFLTLPLVVPAWASNEKKAADPKAPGKAAAAGETAVPSGPMPSRLVAEEAVTPYVSMLRGRLAINGRQHDPFGLSQDLKKATSILPVPVVKTTKKSTPFSTVVKAIPIAAVFPLEQEFLVGSRTFHTGQVFPLVAGGDNLSVRVEAVRSSSVRFKNIRSGEVIEKRLDLLPDGVTPGGGAITVPGVTEQNNEANEPLHINLYGN